MGGIEEEQQMMGNSEFEDQKLRFGGLSCLSEKVITVYCLRGRLLAERSASKAAKEEAELIGKRLEELERQLRMETGFKKKAERKLKLVMDKLEELKLSPSPTTTQTLEEQEPNYEVADSTSCSTLELVEESHNDTISNQFGTVNDDQTNQIVTPGGCSSSDTKKYPFPSNASCVKNSNTSGISPGGETKSQDQDYEETVDNTLAIVKVEDKADTVDSSGAMVPLLHQMDYDSPTDNNVYEVLIALRDAREQLRASIRRTTVYRSHSLGLCGMRDYILKNPIT